MNRRIFLILGMISLLIFCLNAYEAADENAAIAGCDLATEPGNADRTFTETAPPPGPVRPVAEWEPASKVLIRYPLGIPTALVVQLANTVPVVCIVANSSTQTQATNTFNNAGVNMANVSFMIAPTDSYWTRDFGPWFNVNGLNQVGIVDFPYNRPRPNDDEIPRTFATQNNYPLYGMNVTNTGGNYMTDGIYIGAQTDLVLTENSSQSLAQISTKMQNYLGITDFNAIPDPNNTYIDHIDCWGKFLAPDKVLIRSVPTSHAQYDEIEATAAFFASHNCAWGYPYRVYRVYTPQNQPYTNSLILNHRVFVPIMNNSNDNAALAVYRNALPGYDVVGITGASSTPWESTDALHCRTHEIADKEMLNIAHVPYHGETTATYDGMVNADILALSSTNIIPDSTFVCYKVNQSTWQRLDLITDGGTGYTATFPPEFAPGDTIRYFIHTADQSGRSLDHPYTAARDPHMFWLPQDTIAPVIVHNPITDISPAQMPYNFQALITDNHSVATGYLSYSINGSIPEVMDMTTSDYEVFSYLLDTELPISGGYLNYHIIAMDAAGNVSTLPADGDFYVTIAPTANQDDLQNSPVISLGTISPNPLNRKALHCFNISYTAKADSQVQFHIYNLKGQLVKNLSVSTRNAGQYTLSWDAKDNIGNPVSPGMYFVRMESDHQLAVKKVLVLN